MIRKLPFLSLLPACLFSQQPGNDISTQYNNFAQTFSELQAQFSEGSAQAYFRYFTFPLANKKILDLGCGDGYDLAHLKASSCLLYGIDASQEMVSLAQHRVPEANIQVGTFDMIPFPDQSMNIVISKWALQGGTDIDAIYREIARVIKPQGHVVLLITHPLRQFLEKPSHDYFQSEIIETSIFNGLVTAKDPSHTLNEYLSPVFFENFTLEAFEEGRDSGAQRIGDYIYPTYFILKATRKG